MLQGSCSDIENVKMMFLVWIIRKVYIDCRVASKLLVQTAFYLSELVWQSLEWYAPLVCLQLQAC